MVATTATIPQAGLEAMFTPDQVENRLGTLRFRDGAPTQETATTLYDTLEFLRGMDVFLNAFRGASTSALRQGFLSVGVEDNTILIFSETGLEGERLRRTLSTPATTSWWSHPPRAPLSGTQLQLRFLLAVQ
jgi:hypothetical protein